MRNNTVLVRLPWPMAASLEPLVTSADFRLDDNRFDHRPFLYPYLAWPYKKIEEEVKRDEEKKATKQD